MQLTLEEVDKIAALARLELSAEERESFRRQISSILDYVGKLRQLDTASVEPMTHALELWDPLRPDEVRSCDAATRQRLLEAMPARQGDLLKTDAVFS